MKPEFRVGERIYYPGIPMSRWAVLPPSGARFAEVIATYNGAPSATDAGVPLMDIRFEDDGEIKKYCINTIGVFIRPPLMVPTVWIPPTDRS